MYIYVHMYMHACSHLTIHVVRISLIAVILTFVYIPQKISLASQLCLLKVEIFCDPQSQYVVVLHC
jgi:hypothetical protein